MSRRIEGVARDGCQRGSAGFGRWLACVVLALTWTAADIGATPPTSAADNPPENDGMVEWTTFHKDNARTGVSGVTMDYPPYKRLWTFDLGTHTWKYCQGASIWSSSVIGAAVDERMLLYTGSYDHNIYCIDAHSGEEVWRFTTGCLVKASLAFAWVGETPMVFGASSDRAFYGLDARTGKKLWTLETFAWTYTVGESMAGSPLIARINGEQVLYATMWNSDRKPLRTVQTGEIFAIRPVDGELIYRKKLSTTRLSTPTFADIKGTPTLFVGGEDGTLYSCDARDGDILWKYTSGHRIDAAPLITRIGGQPIVILTNAFGMVRALSAVSGAQIWHYKAGHEILSTPTLYQANGSLILALGSSDRCVHALDAKTGERIWSFQTEKYVVASPALASIRGRPTLFVNSLDNSLYGIDGAEGCEIMRFASGDMLWPYETRGASLWSSPSLVQMQDGQALLLYPAHDGKLYAFVPGSIDESDPSSTDARLNDWRPTSPQRHTKAVTEISPLLRFGPPVAAVAFIALGFTVMILPQTNKTG